MIVWFLNTLVFTQWSLCSSSVILFYSVVIISLLCNQSLTFPPFVFIASLQLRITVFPNFFLTLLSN